MDNKLSGNGQLSLFDLMDFKLAERANNNETNEENEDDKTAQLQFITETFHELENYCLLVAIKPNETVN